MHHGPTANCFKPFTHKSNLIRKFLMGHFRSCYFRLSGNKNIIGKCSNLQKVKMLLKTTDLLCWKQLRTSKLLYSFANLP